MVDVMRTVVNGSHVMVFGPDDRLLFDSDWPADLKVEHPLLQQAQREQERQFTEEGYTSEHDDGHRFGELARMAAAYAWPQEISRDHSAGAFEGASDLIPFGWRIKRGQRTVKGRQEELVKAVALLCSEWDRLERGK